MYLLWFYLFMYSLLDCLWRVASWQTMMKRILRKIWKMLHQCYWISKLAEMYAIRRWYTALNLHAFRNPFWSHASFFYSDMHAHLCHDCECIQLTSKCAPAPKRCLHGCLRRHQACKQLSVVPWPQLFSCNGHFGFEEDDTRSTKTAFCFF